MPCLPHLDAMALCSVAPVQKRQDLGACPGCLFTDAHPVLARSLGEPRDCGWLPARLVRRRERRLVQPVSCATAHRGQGLAGASTPRCSTCSRTWGHAVRSGPSPWRWRLPRTAAAPPRPRLRAWDRGVLHPFNVMTDARAPNEPVSVEHVPHKPSTNARPVHPKRTWGLFPG